MVTASSHRRATGIPVAELLSALFEYAAAPIAGERWTGKQIAARAAELGPVVVGESYLSQLRSGGAQHPSLWTVEALARAFEVDVVFFTNGFHDQYVRLPMRERVQWARYLWGDAQREAVAAEILQLPDTQQRAVFALIDILAHRDH